MHTKRGRLLGTVVLALALVGCQNAGAVQGKGSASMADGKTRVATFAGGCFWRVEAEFERLPGVEKAVCGYTGGHRENPTYREVCTGATGHCEAVQVHFDPSRVSYREILDRFWRMIDPTDAGGSFVDRGSQYRSVIFYHDEQQKEEAEKSRDALAASGRFSRPIATKILPLASFYEAEEYHQEHHRKRIGRDQADRNGSGRDRFRAETWGAPADAGKRPGAKPFAKPDEATLRRILTPLQYEVTQKGGTEPPFQNAYGNEKREGIYVDVVSGEPLFSSRDKFDSGTGWPSFTRPLAPDCVVAREDRKLFLTRTEVRSRIADSHLGHVFSDGPEPTGQRYCINSAALRFVPKENMEKEGYGRLLPLFGEE